MLTALQKLCNALDRVGKGDLNVLPDEVRVCVCACVVGVWVPCSKALRSVCADCVLAASSCAVLLQVLEAQKRKMDEDFERHRVSRESQDFQYDVQKDFGVSAVLPCLVSSALTHATAISGPATRVCASVLFTEGRERGRKKGRKKEVGDRGGGGGRRR